jgi:transcriptional regulator with XRE-family HTH domain
MNFSEHLKMLRTDQMLSISKLAQRSNLSQSFVCRIESGEKQPTLETLHKLSRGLGIGIGDLLGESVLSEPESPVMERIISNIRQFSPEQIDALDAFLSSISNGYASGEKPLTLQSIQINPDESEGFEIELTFSSNVSAVMEHRILEGVERNKSCFQLTDCQNKLIPIELVPGSKKKFGKHVDRIFVVRPLVSLDDSQIYTLNISRLLQANNYKYLAENHTIDFTKQEIVNIKPYNQKLCAPYLSLALEKSNLAPGREAVPFDTDIRLTFSNDVCASEIRDHNLSCITLQTSRNQPVDIDIVMAESNAHPEKKKEIMIHPQNGLARETVYILTITGDLMGKNRKCLGTDKVLTFTTGSSASNSVAAQENESIA